MKKSTPAAVSPYKSAELPVNYDAPIPTRRCSKCRKIKKVTEFFNRPNVCSACVAAELFAREKKRQEDEQAKGKS